MLIPDDTLRCTEEVPKLLPLPHSILLYRTIIGCTVGQNSYIRYQTNDSQKNYVNCQVGASLTPNTVACFAASGSVAIDGVSDASYTYDPITDDNINKRSIQGFSTDAQKKMAECENCPYNKMYEKFYDYYGQYDYANQIALLAALSGQKTNFDNFNC